MGMTGILKARGGSCPFPKNGQSRTKGRGILKKRKETAGRPESTKGNGELKNYKRESNTIRAEWRRARGSPSKENVAMRSHDPSK